MLLFNYTGVFRGLTEATIPRAASLKKWTGLARRQRINPGRQVFIALTRVPLPNSHILSRILNHKATILDPGTSLVGPLDPEG